MAAAVTAADAGADITVFEATRAFGGRARALPASRPDGVPAMLDNGQHILIGAYIETLSLMQQVGVNPEHSLLRLPLAMPYPDGSGLQTPAWAACWPAPLNAVAAITTARGWRWSDKLALVRTSLAWQRAGFRCPADLTVAQLCAQLPARVVNELIEPLCVSALNTPAHEASAQVFLKVMQDALFGRGFGGLGASDLLLPRTDLSQLFPEAAASWLMKRHGDGIDLRRGARVQSLNRVGAGWQLAGDGNGEAFDDPFDQVIWCTAAGPAAQAMQLAAAQTDLSPTAKKAMAHWAAMASALPFTAITTVYAWSQGARLSAPMLALRAVPDAHQAPAQFVFDRGQLNPHDPAAQGVLAFVVSASVGERADLQARVLQQAAEQLGLHKLHALQTVVEKRATFACNPGLVRPEMAITPGVWAAGDYVSGPYPATLEGAVRSGVAAARAACRAQMAHQG
jgi:squalene-associated FAD-dependent desaturase